MRKREKGRFVKAACEAASSSSDSWLVRPENWSLSSLLSFLLTSTPPDYADVNNTYWVFPIMHLPTQISALWGGTDNNNNTTHFSQIDYWAHSRSLGVASGSEPQLDDFFSFGGRPANPYFIDHAADFWAARFVILSLLSSFRRQFY